MKRIFYSLLLTGFLFATQTASAQFSLGFVGVFNLPNLTIDAEDFGSTKGSTGYGGGLVAQYQLGDDIAIVLRPTYLNNKGAGLGGLGTGFDDIINELENVQFAADIQLSTIEVPILVKYYFTENSAKPYITAGPSFGLISTAEISAQFSGTIPAFGDDPAQNLDFSETVDIKDELTSLDMSFLLGLGVELPLGSSFYFMDVIYGFGLTNLISDGDGSMKTKGVQISAGARFPIGGSN